MPPRILPNRERLPKLVSEFRRKPNTLRQCADEQPNKQEPRKITKIVKNPTFAKLIIKKTPECEPEKLTLARDHTEMAVCTAFATINVQIHSVMVPCNTSHRFACSYLSVRDNYVKWPWFCDMIQWLEIGHLLLEHTKELIIRRKTVRCTNVLSLPSGDQNPAF